MKNKAASAQNNGAAFAAFRKNFELLLNKHELRIVVTDDLEHLSHDLFLFWELGMQAYFENLPRVGISLSTETNTRWLSQAMVIEIGDSDGRTPPEECGVLLEYGKRFFSIFFREHGGGSDNGGEKGKSHLSFVLTELAMEVLVVVFLKEVAMFAPACSDGRSARGTSRAQIISFPLQGERVH